MTWEALEAVLSATGYEYARQGSYAEAGELPATFFTFWNLSTPEESFYDNQPTKKVWEWQIYLYTKDPALMYSLMDDTLSMARSAGFVLQGRARDIDSGEPGYVGRTATLLYVETI